MANLNKVMLIGRLTRKPEPITIGGVTQGAKFGFAVNNRKYNQDTQQWEEVPVFLDVEIWNRGENQQADRVLQTLRGPDREAGVKASQVYLEGHLKMDQWEDKNGGGKRSKHKVVVESVEFLGGRGGEGSAGGGGMSGGGGRATGGKPGGSAPPSDDGGDEFNESGGGGDNGGIPF